MDAKTRRLMKSKQGRTETGSGNITASEGSSGDIQVRMTSKGPRLFAKLGNKWFISELKDQESSQNEVKMYTFKGIMIAGTSANIPIPSWISSSSVVGVMFFANHSSNLWQIYEWKHDENFTGSHFTQTLTTVRLDTGTATSVFGPVPFSGILRQMQTSVSGDPGADTTLIPTVLGESAAATLTITNGTATNGIDTVTYTSNNEVGAGDIITVASNNGASNNVTAKVTISVEELISSKVRHRVFYDRGQHRIEVDGMGTQIDNGKQYRVIVFYT